MKQTKYVILAALLVLSLVLAGCSAQTASTPQTQSIAPAAQSAVPAATPAQGGDIGLEAAKEAALQHAGLGTQEVTFVKEELDYDDGVAEYDIEFVTPTTKYEYEVRASDGNILQSSQEPINQAPAGSEQAPEGMISVEDAKSAALQHAGVAAGEAVFSKAELDYDDGIAVYEIEFYVGQTEYDYKINATTGAVIEADVDYH